MLSIELPLLGGLRMVYWRVLVAVFLSEYMTFNFVIFSSRNKLLDGFSS